MSDENRNEKTSNMNLESELLEVRSLAHALQYQVEVLQSSENELKQKLTGALRELEHNRHELEDLRFKNGSSDVEIGLYKSEISTLRNSVTELEREAKHWRHEVDEVANEQSHTEQTLRTEVEKLRNRLSSGGRKDPDDDDDNDEEDIGLIDDIYPSNDHEEDDMKSIRSSNNNNTIANLETVISQLTSTISALEEENQALREHLEALQIEHEESSQLDHKKDLFQEEALSLRRELQQLKMEREREVSALVDENQRLFKEQHDLDEQMEQLKKTIASSSSSNSPSHGRLSLGRMGSNSSLLMIRSPSFKDKDSNNNNNNHHHTEDLVHRYESLRMVHSQALGRLQAAKGNILVAVRTRPPSLEEVRMGGKVIIDNSHGTSHNHNGNELMVHDWKTDHWRSFHFDFVWPQEARQEEVFIDIEPLVVGVADGYNGCILAYGVTGSGKSFTIQGLEPDTNNEEDDEDAAGNYGIFQRSVAVLLDQLELKRQRQRRRPTSTALALSKSTKKKKKRRATGFDLPSPFSSNTLESQFQSSPNDHDNDSKEQPMQSSLSSLTKAASFFEVSNPLSRRRSTLHVTPIVNKSQAEREAEEEAYGFTADESEAAIYSMDDDNAVEGDGDDDDDSSSRLQLTMSMIEIYNEQCFDLLSSSTGTTSRVSLDIKQDSTNGGQVIVPGLSSISISSFSEAIEVYAKGNDYRSSSSSSSSARSSRSHLIIMLEVRTCSSTSDSSSSDIISRLYLVDLAGSEKSDKAPITISKWSTTAQKESVRESQHVNQSLSALGEVIEALDKKAAVIPYRNSKLTFLLQNVLSSNASEGAAGGRCLLIATLSPTDLSYEESLSTLSFAAKVKDISLGPAAKNNTNNNTNSAAAVRNLEQALKTARNEAKELKQQKLSLEEALSISRKNKDGAVKIGDKFHEAKVQQLEEAKRAADLFIQQLNRQLHEANSKLVEEKRQRETMALDTELMQRNLKKALQQLHLHEASAAALLRVSIDDTDNACLLSSSSKRGGEQPEETTSNVISPAHSHASSSHSHHSPSHASHGGHSHSSPSSHNNQSVAHINDRYLSPAPNSSSSLASSPLNRGVVSHIHKPYTVIAAKSHLPPSAFPPKVTNKARASSSPQASPASRSNGGFRPGPAPPSSIIINNKQKQRADGGNSSSYDTPPKQFVPFISHQPDSGHNEEDDDQRSTNSHSILLVDNGSHHHHYPISAPSSRASRLPRSASKPSSSSSQQQQQPQLIVSPSSTVTKKVRAGAGSHPWDGNSHSNKARLLPAAATAITPANAAATVRRASTGSAGSTAVAAGGRRPSSSSSSSALSPPQRSQSQPPQQQDNDDMRSVVSAQPSVGSGNMNSVFVRQLPGQKRRSSVEPSPYSQQQLAKKTATTATIKKVTPVMAVAEELIVPYEEEAPELMESSTSPNAAAAAAAAVMGRRLPIPARYSRGDAFQIASLTTQPGLSERAKASMDAHRARIEKKREEKSRTRLLKDKKGRAYGMPSPSSPSKQKTTTIPEQF